MCCFGVGSQAERSICFVLYQVNFRLKWSNITLRKENCSFGERNGKLQDEISYFESCSEREKRANWFFHILEAKSPRHQGSSTFLWIKTIDNEGTLHPLSTLFVSPVYGRKHASEFSNRTGLPASSCKILHWNRLSIYGHIGTKKIILTDGFGKFSKWN